MGLLKNFKSEHRDASGESNVATQRGVVKDYVPPPDRPRDLVEREARREAAGREAQEQNLRAAQADRDARVLGDAGAAEGARANYHDRRSSRDVYSGGGSDSQAGWAKNIVAKENAQRAEMAFHREAGRRAQEANDSAQEARALAAEARPIFSAPAPGYEEQVAAFRMKRGY